MKTVSLKKLIAGVLLFSFILLPVFCITPTPVVNPDIIRLHIIANSDSDSDQLLKLKVRDEVLDLSNSAISSSPLSPFSAIKEQLKNIEDAAKVVLMSYGSYDGVTAQLGQFYFPIKSYGDVTLPAGDYTALRLVIGEGIGQNWWCVVYPPLCFVDETHGVFKQEDIDFLTKNGSAQSGRPRFEIKFKFLEMFK